MKNEQFTIDLEQVVREEMATRIDQKIPLPLRWKHYLWKNLELLSKGEEVWGANKHVSYTEEKVIWGFSIAESQGYNTDFYKNLYSNVMALRKDDYGRK